MSLQTPRSWKPWTLGRQAANASIYFPSPTQVAFSSDVISVVKFCSDVECDMDLDAILRRDWLSPQAKLQRQIQPASMFSSTGKRWDSGGGSTAFIEGHELFGFLDASASRAAYDDRYGA